MHRTRVHKKKRLRSFTITHHSPPPFISTTAHLTSSFLLPLSSFLFPPLPQSAVLSCCFSPWQPHIIIGGTYSGQVVLWDNRAKRTPVQRSALSGECVLKQFLCCDNGDGGGKNE